MRAYRFRPMDTWFFKEARPMDGFGGSELGSVFPPPVRTLLGALRTKIGEDRGVDWYRFPENFPDLAKEIGDAYGYGQIKCRGVFLEYGETILYPLPMHIVHIDHKRFSLMTIGDMVECDIGNVRLPQLPPDHNERRYETIENGAWVKKEDLEKILEGKLPASVFFEKDFVFYEPRVGIGRDRATGTVREGMLYMTNHLRLNEALSVLLELESETEVGSGAVRLGGEGRGAWIEACEASKIQKPKKPAEKIAGVFVSLISPAIVDPLRPFGEEVASAIVGKSVKEGGFDLKSNRSRAAKSYIPAGSTWFMEMEEDKAERFIDNYHDTAIGEETELGRGRIVCGYWTETISTKKEKKQ